MALGVLHSPFMDSYQNYPMYCGANDGGVKRGDRADTGDLEANPTEKVGRGGSGVRSGNSGTYTGDTSAMTEGPGATHPTANKAGIEATGGIEDLTILDAEDPELGLTNIGDIPADDWAADTGSTHSAEEGSGAATTDPGHKESTLTTTPPRARSKKAKSGA